VKPITHSDAVQRFRGEAPSGWFRGDGCTCAPDVAFNGADLRLACRWHDWPYKLGGTEAERRQADRNFLHNLAVSGCPWWQRRAYYYRVRFWGALLYPYRPASERPRLRVWLAILLRRYWYQEDA